MCKALFLIFNVIFSHLFSDKAVSPDKKRITDFKQQRKAFEQIQDNWQDNDIIAKIKTERQQEMEVLLNRFKKPKSTTSSHRIENEPRPISNCLYFMFAFLRVAKIPLFPFIYD